MRCVIVALAVCLCAGLADRVHALEAGIYTVRPGPSEARLVIRGPLGDATARLPRLGGSLAVTADGTVSGAVIADANALSAGGGLIERQIKGPAGLDTAVHDAVRFTVRSATFGAGEAVTVRGVLTARGVGRPVVLSGVARQNRRGRVALRLSAVVDRIRFGITAGRPLYAKRADLTVRVIAVRGR